MQPSGEWERFLDATPDLYLVLDANMVVLAFSRSFLQASQNGGKTLLGRSLSQVYRERFGISREDEEELERSFHRCILDRSPHNMGIRPIAWNAPGGGGTRKYRSVLHIPVYDPQGKLLHILHKAEDYPSLPGEASGPPAEYLTGIVKRAKTLQQSNMVSIDMFWKRAADVKAIFDRISDGFIALDSKGFFIYANSQAERELGMTLMELQGKHIWDVFPKHVREPAFTDALHSCLASGKYHHIEVYSTLYHTWFEAHMYPSSSGLSIFFRDITPRKKAEEELIATGNKYKLLFESNPLPMWIISLPEKNFMAVNDAAIRQYGYTREEFLGMNVAAIRPKEDLALFQEQAEKPIEGIRNVGVWRHIRKDGTIIHVNILIHHIQYEGRPARLVLAIDVTERQQAEEALRHSEGINRLIMSSSLDAIVCMDYSGNISYWNPRAEKIFGWKNDEIMGMALAQTIIPPRYRERHSKGLELYLQTGEGPILNKLVEMDALRKNGEEFPV